MHRASRYATAPDYGKRANDGKGGNDNVEHVHVSIRRRACGGSDFWRNSADAVGQVRSRPLDHGAKLAKPFLGYSNSRS